MSLSLPDIEQLFAQRGDEQYSGEPVTQLEHALQSAQLARDSGASPALVTAALLHDLGHLLHDLGATPTLQGVDDVHQYAAVPFLRGLFGEGGALAARAKGGREIERGAGAAELDAAAAGVGAIWMLTVSVFWLAGGLSVK